MRSAGRSRETSFQGPAAYAAAWPDGDPAHVRYRRCGPSARLARMPELSSPPLSARMVQPPGLVVLRPLLGGLRSAPWDDGDLTARHPAPTPGGPSRDLPARSPGVSLLGQGNRVPPQVRDSPATPPRPRARGGPPPPAPACLLETRKWPASPAPGPLGHDLPSGQLLTASDPVPSPATLSAARTVWSKVKL